MTLEKKPKVRNVFFTLAICVLATVLVGGIFTNCGGKTDTEFGTHTSAVDVDPDGGIDGGGEVEISPNSWKTLPGEVEARLPSAGPRWGHALAFDIVDNVTVLFGGNDGTTVVQDTWEWDGADWTLASSVGPPAREDHAMAYDDSMPGSEVVVLYGGSDMTGNPLGDTWEWDGVSWGQRTVGGTGLRTRHAMAFDRSQGVVVLFGGFMGGLDWQTWIWNGLNWTNVTTATFPQPRENHAMAYDNVHDVTVLFGGYDGTGVRQDTWELAYNPGTSTWDWTPRSSATTPPPRMGHAMDFDSNRGVVVMYGGTDAAGIPRPDTTWEWNGTDWTPVIPYDDPGPRTNHAMAFDEIRDVSVLYGGDDGLGTPLGDTWEYPYLIDGEECSNGVECYSGNCIDGVCCNIDCGTATDDCRACSIAAGSTTDGVCETIAANPAHVCRASTGECDPEETCDGSDVNCPAEFYSPSGTACGDSSDSDCDNPDTCDGNGACLDNFEPTSTECRADAGDCDIAEYCDGAGSCPGDSYEPPGTACGDPSNTGCDNPNTCDSSGNCLDNFEPVGTACGNPSDTVCDDPDTCNGAGTCLDNFEPTSTLCRADAGDCDVPEFCDGAGACPGNVFEPAGTACGSSSDTDCDNPDSCNAVGSCLPNYEPTTLECRPAASECDVAENCDGAGACPVDLVKTLGTPCGSANDDQCDNPDSCDATGICLDNYEPNGTACGSSSDTVCDNPDSCDGGGTCLDNFEPTSLECRADAGDCDVAEFCDGAGSCPSNSFEPPGTTCGSPADTICDNPDTCNANGSCLSNHEPTTFLCRADAGDCDVPEYCDGAGGCPVNSFEPTGTACGDPSDSICDNPDTCDGGGLCLDNFEPTTFQCRADAGDCDVPEYCDGAGSCPANAFEPEDTACGDDTDDVCTNPDTCDDAGVCQDNHEPTTTLCRADAGDCDVAEYCDGAGECPDNVFEPEGTTCGSPADTICDNPDSCSAMGLCLPNHEPGTTLCRADAGECDVPDYCDGAGSCPADAFEPAGTACGDSSNSICDNPDTCDGGGGCLDNFEPITFECREAASDCDVPEFCNGAGSCPTDIVKALGTPCGDPSDTDCTNPDTCNGAGLCMDNHASAGVSCGDTTNTVCSDPDTCDGGGTCQPNHEPTSTQCRADTGECDVAEFCDGAGGCPGDGFEPAGTACGSSADSVCDNPDTCNATGACMQNHEPTTVECRADAGDCDVAEFCDGMGGCPTDLFVPAGTSCGNPANTTCTNPDTCNATGTCLENNAPTTTECRPAVNDCDIAENCDGNGSCPGDGFVANGVACGSGVDDVCTDPDTCDGAGTCLANHEPVSTVCHPSTDVCDPAEYCDGSGVCPVNLFEDDGTACDDSNPCSSLDTCNGGVCQAGATDKDTDGDTFFDELCPGGTDCNDNDENVNPGVVEASFGDPVCDDNIDNDCDGFIDTDGNGGSPDVGCLQCIDDSDCNDNDVCNGIETCNTAVGLCLAGTALDCDDTNICTDDSCDALTGCANVPNTVSCDDGNACTVGDTCAAGVCSGADRDCSDGNICTTDTCDIATGCINTNNTDPCDDGNACTVDDTCSGGVCESGADLDCDDSNVCTTDSCNTSTGCVNTNNTEPCDDGNACTANDTCAEGVCESGPGLDCNDANPCTTDACTPADGCSYTNNTEPCDDGDACTVDDTCSGGACESGADLDCDDSNVCTTDSCNTSTGCVNTNNTEPCDDSDACTTADTCADGICVGGTALICDDSNVCTTDLCDASTGCVNTNNTDPCDDGDACSTTDLCSEGVCVPGAIDKDTDQDTHIDANCENGTDCNDDDPLVNPDIFEGPDGNAVCSDDIDNDCDDLTDLSDPTCLACTADADCDDNDICNGAETCVTNVCVPGTGLDCDDENICTTDTCDAINGCQHTNNTLACDDNDECTSNDVCAGGVCAGTGSCTDGGTDGGDINPPSGGGCGCGTDTRGAAAAIPFMIFGLVALIRRRRRN